MLLIFQKLLKFFLAKAEISTPWINNHVYRFNTWLYAILLLHYQANMRAYFIKSNKEVAQFDVSECKVHVSTK